MSFFAELKRRNVFKVAIAYGITSWVIAQMAGLAADSFLAPDWVMKMIITILLLGFPVALVMAWAYEMTPDGLRREAGDESEHSKTQATGKLDRTIIIALVAALAYIAYDKLVVDPNREAALLESASQPSVEVMPESKQLEKPAAMTDLAIAVLPFVNMSDDGANEYFSDGLSEELLNLLVKIPELQVAARTSSFSFKGKNLKIPQIARELGVTYVLEGSVRKAGNHVRITAQLIKADGGFHLWSETYDRNLDDIFVVQDDIANAVVSALRITLLGDLPETRQTDPEVYSLYLRGKYLDNLKGKENLEQAVSLFKEALTIDPDYAPAWIGLSVTYQSQRKYTWLTNKQAFALSMAATERALEIDSNMAEAWSSLAYLKKQQFDWAGAKAAIDKAMLLEPNSSLVLGTSASLAGNLGQLQTTIELFERVVRLNPLSLSSLRALGIRYSDVGRHDDAIETFNRVIAINPDYPGIHINLGAVYLLKGDPETALIEINKNPSAYLYPFMKARVLTTLGNEAEAQAIIDEILKTTPLEQPGSMALTYAWRGENDLAFEWFEKAFQQKVGGLAYFLEWPWTEGLKTDPRYAAFVEKLGLLEYWKAMPKPEYEAQP